MSHHQAAGAYRRWLPPSFDDPAPQPAPAAPPEPPVEPFEPDFPEPPELPVEPEPEPEPAPPPPPPPDPAPEIHLPTAEDIERIHEEARKEGYDAGYEEGTARGRVEAMALHSLVQGMDDALGRLDQEVAEEILTLSIEIARQMVRHHLDAHPEAVGELIREALLQMPQTHALVHLNPDDLALARDYLGEQLTHAGHRLVEDASISRGGVRIDAGGSQIDATVQTRWRRILDNLGRNVAWDGDGS